MTATTRSPLRSPVALAFAVLLALSLVLTTAEALAATPLLDDHGANDTPPGLRGREFFHGRGLLGVSWE